MKADTGHVLMSDVLKGQVPELEGEVPAAVVDRHVVVVIEKVVSNESTAVIGVLRGVLLGAEVELEFKCELKEALDILETKGLSIGHFELHHDQRVLQVPGPFIVKAARLDEISPVDQLCALGLHMTKLQR